MRKFLKKSLSVFLAAVMLVSAAPLGGFVGLELPSIGSIFSFAAEEPDYVEAPTTDFTYTALNGTYCTITKYTGNDKAIIIPSEIDGYIVQKISSDAFEDNKTIEKVVFPETLESVGSNVFYGCTKLTYVGFNNKLTNIGNSMFNGCTALTGVTIPVGITSIGSSAFANCTNLTTIKLPETLKTIDYNAFYRCIGLTSIGIPDSVTAIAGYAFDGCTNLSEVKLSSGWNTTTVNSTSYSCSPFTGCTKLTEITIPEGMTAIPNYAFRNCTVLKTVNFHDGVKMIGSYAFRGCTGLTGIDLPDSLTTINSDAFEYCTGLKNITIPEGVVAINNNVFSGCTGLTEVSLPKTLTTIAVYAFNGCTGLASIDIPDSVTAIAGYAFDGCTNLSEVKLSSGWNTTTVNSTSYSCSPFTGCTKLTEITIPEGMTAIPSYAFSGCTSLKKVILPDSLEKINSYAFRNCTGLSTLDLPDTVKTINSYAFSGCSGFRMLNLNENLESIGSYAFSGCNGLVSLVLNENLVTLSNYAFANCANLTAARVPKSVTSFGKDSFQSCPKLTIYCYSGSAAHMALENTSYTYFLLDEHEHEYETTVETAATCTRGGSQIKTCTICGYNYIELVDPLGHDYSKEWTVDTESTCTVNGSKSHHCSRCDSVSDVTEIPATGHYYGEYTVTSSSTCTGKGQKQRVCSVCGYTDVVTTDALGHDFSNEWTIDKEANCSSDGSKSHHCSRCDAKADVTVIERLPHTLETVKTVEPTCTNRGYTTYKCSVCGYTVNDNYVDATGHNFNDWKVVKEPDCTNRGYSIRTCSVCNTEEREYTNALGHNLGEWTVAKAATVLAEGEEVQSCSRCQYNEKRVIDRIKIDIDKNANYGLAKFTVVNAQTKEPIKGASIFISTENDGENTFTTDMNGQVSIVLPVGKQSVSVYADKCITRNLNINVKSGINDIPLIGLSDKPTYEATVTHHLMTYDEIIEAGIDTSATDNNHVYKYELHLEFKPEIDWESIAFYWGDGGICLGAGGGSGSGSGSGSSSGSGSGSGWVPKTSTGGGYYHIERSSDDGKQDYYVYPVSEYFYLIISGEVKWLKEMFDVEMLVVNNSETDTLENLVATLELPEGLSLATMIGDQQTETQKIGTIEGGGSKSVHWYVRGDTAGSYEIKALLEGMVMPFEEEIHDEFIAENALQVWAGNALHLDFSFPDSAFYGEDYPVTITLTNVSDITLYNVSHIITGVEQGRVTYYSDGHKEEEVYMSQHSNLPSSFASEFKPGDKMVFEMSINIMFESKLIEYQLQKLIGLVDGIEQFMNAYKAITAATKALNKLASTITKCASALDSFTPSLIGEVNHDNKVKVFNTLRKQLFGLASSYGTTGNKTADSALKLANSGLDGVYTAIYEDPEDWFNKTSIEEMKKIVDNTAALTNSLSNTGTSGSNFDVYDSIRTAIYAIPIRFVLRRAFMIEDEDNTTSIPWSYSTTHVGPRYFGVSNVSKYLFSIGETAAKDYISDQIPWYGHLVPGVDDALDTTDVKNYIKATENEIARVQAKDATGEIHWKAYIVRNDAARTASRNKAPAILSGYVLSSDNPTAVTENGVLTFTGPGMIEITPIDKNGGTLVIENSEGYTYSYEIEVVESHTCIASKQETIISPTAEDDGFAVKRCDICGDVLEIIILEHDKCETHSFSEWTIESEATCTASGMKTRECTNCGYIETEFTDAVGHTEEIRNYVKETCTTDGYSGDIYCSVCGELISQGETINASGHDYASVVTKPTCTTDGYTTHTCSLCGDSYTDSVVEALGHTEVAIGEAKNATCTEDGITAGVKCSVCGEVIEAQQIIKANGHKYVSVVTKPTCTTDGYTTHTCSVCGDSYTDSVVEALGHTEVAIGEAKEATCTEDGITAGVKCSVCGEVIEAQQIIKATGHKYVSVVTKPTCTTDGYTTYTCSVCGDTYTSDVVAKTGHSWTWVVDKDATCGAVGYKHQKCTKCDAVQSKNTVIPATGNHNYNEGTVIEKPSCTAEGKLVKTCSTCGHEVEEVLPKTEHIDNDDDGYCDECGADLSPQDPTTHCSCNCHKSGIVKFFWKIANFFHKIFKMEKYHYCDCGAAHW